MSGRCLIQEFHLRTVEVVALQTRTTMPASASLDVKTRGSLVLKRNLSINVLQKFGSKDGGISYIKKVISGRSLTTILLHLQDLSLVLGADMNYFMNLTLDKSVERSTSSKMRASNDFLNFLSALSLTDLYRTINPTSKQYPSYSA